MGAPKWSSAAGRAVKSANGNCGWGDTGDWKDPSSSKCDGQYAYDDKTCDANCLIVEGIYWASVSYIGGLYTKKRASDTRREWLMATPDATMVIELSQYENAEVEFEPSQPLFVEPFETCAALGRIAVMDSNRLKMLGKVTGTVLSDL